MSANANAGRPLSENSLRLYRAVAAHSLGLTSVALHDRFENVIDSEVISQAMQSMARGGYVKRAGSNRCGSWIVTKKCKVPKGEFPPAWLATVGDTAPDGDDTTKRAPTEVAMPAAPASAFNLHAGFSLPFSSHGGVHVKPKTEAVKGAEPAAPKEGLGWNMPAEPTLRQQIALKAGESAAVTPVQRAPDFLCYLDSDGELYLYSRGDELSLDLENTRKLMHYLDHMRASDLVEAAASAGAAA